MKTNDNINYTADKGKVFVRKADGMVMGWGIGLGSADSIENYYETECPDEYKGQEGFDNTINEKVEAAETAEQMAVLLANPYVC